LGERDQAAAAGTHDPAMFIRPEDLNKRLRDLGFIVGKFVGMGPTGVNLRLDFQFGRFRSTAVQYLGQATRGAFEV